MYTLHRDALPNGLRVITLETPYLHSALLAVYVRCGSRHETARNNGVSHFLEHLFFRGSERFPDTRRMNGFVEDAGGSLNGVTMRDSGLYYTSLHPSRLDVGFEVLGDVLCRPLLTHLDVEREVILEEMMDEVDPKGRDIDPGNLSKFLVFGDHPLALKIAGTPETVRALTLDDMRAQHQRYYVGANLVVAAAGPLRHDQVLELAERAFGALPAGEPAHELKPEPRSEGPSFRFVTHDESQTELLLTFPCRTEGHPDHPALMAMRALLDDGLSSWLQLNVVERKGLAYSVHAGLDVFSDVGLFELEAACTPGKVVAVVEEMAALLERLRSQPVSDEELARIKRRHRLGLDFALDDLNSLSGWYGGTELFRRPESLEERCRAVEAVTAAQLQEVAARVFRRDNLFAVAVGPAKGRAEQALSRVLERCL